MIISKGFVHAPASDEAKALGCTCKVVEGSDPDNPSYLIGSNCPVHWNLDLVAMKKQLDQTEVFLRRTSSVHTNLLLVLIVLFITVFWFYVGTL